MGVRSIRAGVGDVRRLNAEELLTVGSAVGRRRQIAAGIDRKEVRGVVSFAIEAFAIGADAARVVTAGVDGRLAVTRQAEARIGDVVIRPWVPAGTGAE